MWILTEKNELINLSHVSRIDVDHDRTVVIEGKHVKQAKISAFVVDGVDGEDDYSGLKFWKLIGTYDSNEKADDAMANIKNQILGGDEVVCPNSIF